MKVRSFRDLSVWQRGMELTVAVYDVTRSFPREELFGLAGQLRRAAVSIPSNIAEGQSRGTQRDFRQFLLITRGSTAEVQTQLLLTRSLRYSDDERITRCEALSSEVGRLLNGLIASLKVKSKIPRNTSDANN